MTGNISSKFEVSAPFCSELMCSNWADGQTSRQMAPFHNTDPAEAELWNGAVYPAV